MSDSKRLSRLGQEVVWHQRLAPRCSALWKMKTTGGWLSSGIFFSGYFLLLNHPLFQVRVVPELVLDHWIGVSSLALIPYASLWIYIWLAPGLLDNRRELLIYYAGIICLSLAGMLIFLLWPSASAQPQIEWAHHPAFAPLRAVDRSGNALPSLHAAFAVFTAIWLDRLLRHPGEIYIVRSLNVLWCAAILYSTLATKQHVLLDTLAGALLGTLVAQIHGRFLPIEHYLQVKPGERVPGSALQAGHAPLAGRGDPGAQALTGSATEKLSAAPVASTLMTSPAANLPSRMERASGFSTRVWMARLRGRAPKIGS